MQKTLQTQSRKMVNDVSKFHFLLYSLKENK